MRNTENESPVHLTLNETAAAVAEDCKGESRMLPRSLVASVALGVGVGGQGGGVGGVGGLHRDLRLPVRPIPPLRERLSLGLGLGLGVGLHVSLLRLGWAWAWA